MDQTSFERQRQAGEPAPWLPARSAAVVHAIDVRFVSNPWRAPQLFRYLETHSRLMFTGPGAIAVDADTVSIFGRRAGLSGYFMRRVTRVRRNDVVNVETVGRFVRFEGPIGRHGRMRTVTARANDTIDAGILRRVLPERRTRSFDAQHAEVTTFVAQLALGSSITWATNVIIVLNVLVFLLMLFNGGNTMLTDATLVERFGGNFGPDAAHGEWWRLVTSNFVHFGLFHLLGNLAYFYVTGRLVERLYGTARFAALYLIAGLAGTASGLALHPWLLSAGASAPIMGVIGALIACLIKPGNGIPKGVVRRHLSVTCLFAIWVLIRGMGSLHVDNVGHIGGLLGGFIAGLLLYAPLRTRGTAPATTARQFAGAIAFGAVVVAASIACCPRYDVQTETHLRFVIAVDTYRQRTSPLVGRLAASYRALQRNRQNGPALAERLIREVAPGLSNEHVALLAAAYDPQRDATLRNASLAIADDEQRLFDLTVVALRENRFPTKADAGSILSDMKDRTATMNRITQTLIRHG